MPPQSSRSQARSLAAWSKLLSEAFTQESLVAVGRKSSCRRRVENTVYNRHWTGLGVDYVPIFLAGPVQIMDGSGRSSISACLFVKGAVAAMQS